MNRIAVKQLNLLRSVAGVDTSSTTLSYICWELSRRADIAQKLHAELDMAMPDGKTIPDLTVLHNLPYLTAVIKEGQCSRS